MHQERFSWQHGDGGIGGEHTCSHTHEHTSACAADHAGHTSVPEEPTEADIKGALKESYTELEACIAAINDDIAELQEIRADLVE
jgi:hypothetical protein